MKAQIDNRYTHSALGFGETAGQFYIDAPESALRGAIDFVARTTEMNQGGQGGYAQLYQGFLDWGWAEWESRMKLGRFQRTDQLGFYLLDGATWNYLPKNASWSYELYAGRPSRFDHFLSTKGQWIAGMEGQGRWPLDIHLLSGRMTLDTVEIRTGYQHSENAASPLTKTVDYPQVGTSSFNLGQFLKGVGLGYTIPHSIGSSRFSEQHGTGVDRIGWSTTAVGKWPLIDEGGKYEVGVAGTFRADRAQLENIVTTAQWDVVEGMRFRGSYEYYQPRQPYFTFREKFYSTYALGEQTLLRTHVHITPTKGFTYYLGGMRATRQGEDGYGADIGGRYAFTPNMSVLAELDELSLGQDHATSGYMSFIHTPYSQLEWRLNGALRYEEKALYGDNRALGAEGELRYLFRYNVVFHLAGSYIWNTRTPDEYLGAVQITYYFDPFRPLAMQ